MAKIAIISYAEDEYDRDEVQDITNIASWCHSCGEHGLKIDVKIQPDNG